MNKIELLNEQEDQQQQDAQSQEMKTSKLNENRPEKLTVQLLLFIVIHITVTI